jgi:peroxiredoxin
MLTQAHDILQAGTKAPGFTLPVTPDQKLSLGELAGRRAILTFYPADWSPVCGDQLTIYNQLLPEFRGRGAELLGISVDGAWCHQAYAQARNLHFPLLADFHPKGQVAMAYGCYMEDAGEAARALFLIDEGGTIVWSYLSPLGINPGADGILDALDRMPKTESLDVSAQSPSKRA